MSALRLATGFHVLPLTVAGLLVLGVIVSWRRTGATWTRTALVATATLVGLGIWLGGTYAAADLGTLRFTGAPPTMMVLLALMTALSIGLGVSAVGRRLATGLPLWVLVASQSFRLPLELLMHEAYEAGLMPVEMSYSGLNFDIVTGASALVVAVLLGTRRAGVRLAKWWNVLGTVLLCNIVTVALLSAPTPLRVFTSQPANTWVTAPPFVWLPSVLVAFAILGHIVVYRAGRTPALQRSSAQG